jgi:hypothetical protein
VLVVSESDDERVKRGRERFDAWIASLPNVEENSEQFSADTKKDAQKRILAKMITSEDKDALFWFSLSFLDYLFYNGLVGPPKNRLTSISPSSKDPS